MSWRLAGLTAVALAGLLLLARATQAPESGTASWDGSRAAGFAGYLLLWAATASGLALHLRIWRGTWMGVLLELHRVASTLGLAFVAVHVVALLVDPVIGFSPMVLVAPWTSPYRPWATGLGVLAGWLVAAVLLSTAAAAYLGRQRWYLVHLLAYPSYVAALLHGLVGGTDRSATPSVLLYAATAAVVGSLAAARVVGGTWRAVVDEA